MAPSPAFSDAFWRGSSFEPHDSSPFPHFPSMFSSRGQDLASSQNFKNVNPKADWTVEELNFELDELEKKAKKPLLPVPAGIEPVSWQSFHQTVTSGIPKPGFRMALEDDSDESDNSDLSEKGEEIGAEDAEHDAVFKSMGSGLSAAGQKSKGRGQGRGAATAEVVEEVSQAAQKVGQELQISKGTPEEVELFEADKIRLLHVQEKVRQRQLALERALSETRRGEAAALQAVRRDEVAWREALRRADNQDQWAIAEARDEYLSAIQREHAQRTQVGERRLKRDAAVEEARRRELAAQAERERQARAKAEAEARTKALEEARREGERIAAEARERAQAEAAAAADREQLARGLAERRAREEAKQRAAAAPGVTQGGAAVQGGQPGPGPASSGGPRPRVAEGAAQAEAQRLELCREAEEKARPFQTNEALKKERKMLERKITLHIQQISATQEQIRRKTSDLLQLLANPGLPQQFLALTLANKLLSQCEAQVQQLPSFAFALAQVLVDVSSQVPWVMDVVIGRLNQVCIYTVPKYYVHAKGDYATEADYFKLIGYREKDGKLESTDAYVARMSSYITFFGAIVQTAPIGGRHPFGLQEGWAWCARLLNRVPPNRITASALEAFMKMAGYRLHHEYPRPFMKLLGAVHGEYLGKLKESNDPDARAVYNKLETYILSYQFKVPPEGRDFPVTDESSQIRA